MKVRIGFGFDVHKLVEGRDLWMGGVKIPHSLGLLGHSDADVLIHAICDAIWVLPICATSAFISLTQQANTRILIPKSF